MNAPPKIFNPAYLFCASNHYGKKRDRLLSAKPYKSFEMYKESLKLHKFLSPCSSSQNEL
jgi:hypothetical protein